MLRFALGLLYFFRFHFVFLFVKSYVGWEICAFTAHLHVFCFQLEGQQKVWWLSELKILELEGVHFAGGWGGGGSVSHYMSCLFTVLCLSLDWKILFSLDFFKNHLAVASEMFDVFCWKLYKMIPQNCRQKKLGDEVTENWHNVEDTENELDCDSND